MIKSFNVIEESFLDKILTFNKIELRQVTLLLGGNGVGKSSLINAILKKEIHYESDGKLTKFYSYVNSKQNFRELERNDKLTYSDMFNPNIILRMHEAQVLSEGQSIMYSLEDIFDLCDVIKDNRNDSLVLLDEIDSGLFVDNIKFICEKIQEKCINNSKLQFIIAFNNYEFCRNFSEVFNMYNGKWISIDSYDEYYDIIIKNNKKRGLVNV